jgi:aldehyde:ferredoxin oxidoreductase
MVGGYAGKILTVNLSISEVKKTSVDMGMARDYIGGRGLFAYVFHGSALRSTHL